jgi:hypothetical protein
MSKLLVEWDTALLVHDVRRHVHCVATCEDDAHGQPVYGFTMQDRDTLEDLTAYAGRPRSLAMGVHMLIAEGRAREV